MLNIVRTLVVCAVSCALVANVSAAVVVVNPLTGLDSVGIDQRFVWSGTGPIDYITGPGGDFGTTFDPFWELTVGVTSELNLLALDGFVPGDSFDLVVDGVTVAWDNEFFDGPGFFHGEMFDFVVGPGTTQFTINVRPTSLSDGAAYLNFSAATASSAVPEPSSCLVMGGLAICFGAGIWNRKRKTGS